MRIRFVREKETKNAMRFKEDAPEGQENIGVLYIKKSALNKIGNPDRVTFTLAAEDEGEQS